MILKKHEIPVNYGPTDIVIRHITDVHMDSDGFYGSLFENFVRKQAADKHSYWICTGDLLDSDRPSMRDRKRQMFSDRPEAFNHEDMKSLAWIDKAILPKLERIKDRCLGILDGDHFIIFSNGMTSTQYICNRLKIPYLGERIAYVGVHFTVPGNSAQRCLYTILARHGKGSGVTSG